MTVCESPSLGLSASGFNFPYFVKSLVFFFKTFSIYIYLICLCLLDYLSLWSLSLWFLSVCSCLSICCLFPCFCTSFSVYFCICPSVFLSSYLFFIFLFEFHMFLSLLYLSLADYILCLLSLPVYHCYLSQCLSLSEYLLLYLSVCVWSECLLLYLSVCLWSECLLLYLSVCLCLSVSCSIYLSVSGLSAMCIKGAVRLFIEQFKIPR